MFLRRCTGCPVPFFLPTPGRAGWNCSVNTVVHTFCRIFQVSHWFLSWIFYQGKKADRFRKNVLPFCVSKTVIESTKRIPHMLRQPTTSLIFIFLFLLYLSCALVSETFHPFLPKGCLRYEYFFLCHKKWGKGKLKLLFNFKLKILITRMKMNIKSSFTCSSSGKQTYLKKRELIHSIKSAD